MVYKKANSIFTDLFRNKWVDDIREILSASFEIKESDEKTEATQQEE